MSFLNIALLGGLAAFSIPIIIHLFHKSRFQVVKWGAMHLLESVIRTNQRRVRIEQIILMILRAAIPVLLALLMARPVWTGAQKLLGESKSSTVVLLDNSYSMEAGRTGVSNFSLARDEATRIVSDLKRGSDVQVILMGEGGAALLDQPTYDTGRITQALGKVTAGYGTATVPAALRYAAGVFGQMREPARELIVLTDFQRVSFEATEDAALGESLAQLAKLPIAPRITFFDVGQEVKDNVAIESLDFPRLMVGVGQKVQIRVNVRNYGEGNYKDLRVYFKVDGKERAVSQLPTLPPHEKGQLLFSYAFPAPGSHVIEVMADADTLKSDNLFLASIPVRDKMPVLLVNGDPSSDPLKGETDFAEIALQPYTAGRVELADLISTKVIRADELDSKRLAESAVVVLANVRTLNDQQLRGIEDFVKNGGGLLVFAGNRIDQGWYNGAFFKEGKGLLPMALGALSGDANSPPVSIVSQRFENPALELFNDSRNGTLSESAIRIWFKLKEPATPAGGGDAPAILARLANGDPFLAEKAFGEGRVISCATAIDSDWSNLPLRSTYVPLLQRLVVYLASTIYPSRNLDAGKPIIALFPPAEAGKKATLTTPDGITLDLPIIKKGERGVIEFGKTEQPGLYTLIGPGGAPIHYVVNASRRESDLQKLSAKEIEDLAAAHHVALVHNGAEYRALDHSLRFGRELWKPLLWALLALVFLEMILAQRFARPRRKPRSFSSANSAGIAAAAVAQELHETTRS